MYNHPLKSWKIKFCDSFPKTDHYLDHKTLKKCLNWIPKKSNDNNKGRKESCSLLERLKGKICMYFIYINIYIFNVYRVENTVITPAKNLCSGPYNKDQMKPPAYGRGFGNPA